MNSIPVASHCLHPTATGTIGHLCCLSSLPPSYLICPASWQTLCEGHVVALGCRLLTVPAGARATHVHAIKPRLLYLLLPPAPDICFASSLLCCRMQPSYMSITASVLVQSAPPDGSHGIAACIPSRHCVGHHPAQSTC
jgi:hypothetical protein